MASYEAKDPVKVLLQCGRIYKDAEISSSPAAHGRVSSGFNVAASIKMRKFFRYFRDACRIAISFNVAASIKMRKFDSHARASSSERPSFNVAASIKMRKSKTK